MSVELYNPLLRVLFVDNEKLINKTISHKDFKNSLLKIPISRFMKKNELIYLLMEAAINKFKA